MLISFYFNFQDIDTFILVVKTGFERDRSLPFNGEAHG